MSDAPDTPDLPASGPVRQPLLTWALIAASVAVAVASNAGAKKDVLTWLTFTDLRMWLDLQEHERTVMAGFDSILGGQVWRLVTPIFIHFGLLHLLFNMMWMKDLGELIQRRWSAFTLGALVLVSGVLSNVAQFIVNWDLQSGVRWANTYSGGMSGVVYCLLGYVWIRGRFDPAAGLKLHPQTVFMMLAWLVVCTGALGHIGNSAHATGLLVGVVAGWLAARSSAARLASEDSGR